MPFFFSPFADRYETSRLTSNWICCRRLPSVKCRAKSTSEKQGHFQEIKKEFKKKSWETSNTQRARVQADLLLVLGQVEKKSKKGKSCVSALPPTVKFASGARRVFLSLCLVVGSQIFLPIHSVPGLIPRSSNTIPNFPLLPPHPHHRRSASVLLVRTLCYPASILLQSLSIQAHTDRHSFSLARSHPQSHQS